MWAAMSILFNRRHPEPGFSRVKDLARICERDVTRKRLRVYFEV
jgi:hypothetical protein